MKTCSICRKDKRLSDFVLSNKSAVTGKRHGDGRKNICKACACEREKQRIASMPQDKRAAMLREKRLRQKAWDRKRPHYQRAAKANLHAVRVGASGTICEKDVADCWETWKGKCWVCGHTATQLDHYQPINHKGGGMNTPDNIRPICRECNQKRSHGWHGAKIADKEAALLRQLKELIHGSK